MRYLVYWNLFLTLAVIALIIKVRAIDHTLSLMAGVLGQITTVITGG